MLLTAFQFIRVTYSSFALAVMMVVLASSPASAACRIMPFEFSPLQNDTRTVLVFCDASGGRLSLNAGLNWITAGNAEFTGAKVLRHPARGKLRDADGFSYFYTPNRGYAGKDSYSISVCAKDAGKSGCSTLNFDVTVQ
ncbi:MAG: hypothetical protein ACRCXM_14230 [Beijerinckiaceae bacterium]